MKNEAEIVVLEELANSLKESAEAIDAKTPYDDGRRMGYYEALSTLLSQCDVMGISPSDIGMEGFVPESLLSRPREAERKAA